MSERLSKIQEKNKVYESLDAWKSEGRRLFGPDVMDWKFVCPSCQHVQSVRDYREAGAPEGAVAFSCVGRYLDKNESTDAFSGEAGPCNYAGGGLFRLNPVTINLPDGRHTVFEFAVADNG